MTRVLAVLFGIFFIFIGISGLLHSFTTNGLLFGFFEVTTLQSLVHIISGVIAIMAATSFNYAQLYFQIFGIVYVIMAIVGFLRHNLLFMHVNFSDNLLHAALGIVALIIGFKRKIKSS